MVNGTPRPIVRAMNDRVFIRKQPSEHVSPGGIFLGELKDDVGVVVAVGPGKLRNDGGRAPMWVEPGQEVFFSPNGHAKAKVGGEELLVIGVESIIGVIEP